MTTETLSQAVNWKSFADLVRRKKKDSQMPKGIHLSLSQIALLEQGKFNLSLSAYLSLCRWIGCGPETFILSLREKMHQQYEWESLKSDYIESLEQYVIRLAAVAAGKLKDYERFLEWDELTGNARWAQWGEHIKILTDLSEAITDEPARNLLLIALANETSFWKRHNGGLEKASEIAVGLLNKEGLMIEYHAQELQDHVDEWEDRRPYTDEELAALPEWERNEILYGDDYEEELDEDQPS